MPVSVGGINRGRPLHAGEAGGRGEKKELRGGEVVDGPEARKMEP